MKLDMKARAVFGSAVLLAYAAPASAEVIRTTDDSFVSRHEVVVEASPKEVWLALISPADWWQSEHTWSGSAKNLSLMPKAGGCFCETIPEVDEPGRFTLEGSVEHMRVIQAYPESALRMVGNLGPLQSEPVTGVLTIAISKVPKGTRIVWEYNVGGPMRYEVPVISKAVDGVMGAQISALAKPLKVVPVAAPAPAPAPVAAPAPAPVPAPAPPAAPKPSPASGGTPAGVSAPPAAAASKAATGGAPASAPAAAAKPPEAKPQPQSSPRAAPKAPTVADTFGDLGEPPKP